MENVLVVYWSGTGNTEKMAEAVAEGAAAAGAAVSLTEVGKTTAEAAVGYSRIAFGCPSMGAEVLEENEMEPFFTALESKLGGKSVALFGSYGWGDGEWMRDWEARVKKTGASLCLDQGVICVELPDDEALAACKALGAALTK